ncbi:MAG: hypothetical protein IH596_00595 [Bacteroidales bacterium]|nr:hypothetical protein [Bacteroidales bacterium]
MSEVNDWEEAQQEILRFLVEILHRIEWRYGDNRAPFKYPPEFSLTDNPDGTQSCQCIIETDLGEPEEFIRCVVYSPGDLLDEVKATINQRFPMHSS